MDGFSSQLWHALTSGQSVSIYWQISCMILRLVAEILLISGLGKTRELYAQATLDCRVDLRLKD